jgi:hypothetical protein
LIDDRRKRGREQRETDDVEPMLVARARLRHPSPGEHEGNRGEGTLMRKIQRQLRPSGEGSGLIGLRDQVEALGGTIEIASPPGGGTTLNVRIPIEAG